MRTVPPGYHFSGGGGNGAGTPLNQAARRRRGGFPPARPKGRGSGFNPDRAVPANPYPYLASTSFTDRAGRPRMVGMASETPSQ